MYKNDKQSIIKAQSGDKEELEELIKNNNSIYNTLLISPPGMRKDDIVA